MVNTNTTNLVTNPTRVDQPQPAIFEGEVASRSSPAAGAAVKAEVETAPRLPSATRAGNPESIPSIPAASFQQSSRVWNLYEKAEQFDSEFCKGWNGEIDALLTFAGLFSAVVTAFTVESYKFLQPDPQDVTNRILLNLTAQLTGRNATAPPEAFTPSASSLRINILWFLSLTLSLTSGLVGILCKQWLRHYREDISKPPKEAMAFRQFRYDAFSRCRVMEILSALPILLGLGLILFFIGLIDFLQGLNVMVSIPITILIGAGFAFLVVTTSMPAFQYLAAIQHSYSRRTNWNKSRPPLFAFKSPQSLAILHLATWLCPLSDDLKVPNWASLELKFFSYSSVLQTYTQRALTWLDETYSHSLDMVGQICLCLQDVENTIILKDMDEDSLWDFAMEESSAAVVKSLFDGTCSNSEVNQAEGHIRRDIIAMRYLYPFRFDQYDFAILEHLIRTLNSSPHLKIPSFEPFWLIFSWLSLKVRDRPVEQLQEVIWQRAMLFRNLLSEGRWGDSTEIPWEVQNVSKNLGIFTDEDLNSIFNTLHAWMDQHPQHADLPTHCWVALTSGLNPHELDGALRDRPPVRDFMAFLDSRFRMGAGVEYLCNFAFYYHDEMVDSFFTALDVWINRNPQDVQSFIHCRALVVAIDSWKLERMRDSPSFRDFEALLEGQTARNKDVVTQGPIRNS